MSYGTHAAASRCGEGEHDSVGNEAAARQERSGERSPRRNVFPPKKGYLPSQTPTRGDNQSKRRRRSAIDEQTKNHRGRLWFRPCAYCCATDLSPSLPTKLADGLGLKDTPLAWRDAPRAFGSSALSNVRREIRQTTCYRIFCNIPQVTCSVK